MSKENQKTDVRSEQLSGIFGTVNKLLGNVNTEALTADSSEQFSQLPDGYYLAEVVKVELSESKSSKNPMIAWQFKTVENGISINDDMKKIELKNTTNKRLNMYHVLKDANTMERFISDALKFEGDTEGEPLLEKEYFTTAETLNDALELLVGCRIWLHVDTDDNNATWTRMVSWKRAVKLGIE